jgi:hypothetical protein
MYMQLQQRHDASENFNRGLGLLAASAYPGRHPEMIMNAMTGASGADPGSTFGNLMKIQQWNIQNQQQAALRMAIPNMLKQAGLDESYAPLVQADPSILSKLVENQAGIGGGPAWQAQIRAEKAYTAAGKTPPWTAGDPASYGAYVQGQNTEAVARHKDLVADTANFVPAKNAYDSMISDAQNLLTTPGLDDIVGSWTNKSKSAGTPGLAPTTQSALAAYDKIMGQQYASGVQDFKGAGRISQQELKQDLPGQSTMSNRMQSPTDFRAGVQAYIDKLQTKRATLAGQAGQLGQLSDHDYSLVNDVYKPGGDLYVPGQAQRAAPAIVTSPDDVAKLPPGRAYIVPSGSHKGETRYAGIAQ